MALEDGVILVMVKICAIWTGCYVAEGFSMGYVIFHLRPIVSFYLDLLPDISRSSSFCGSLPP